MRLGRLLATVSAAAVLLTGVVTTVTAPAATAAPATSSLGGPITRSEVIARAKAWYDHNPGPYDQGAFSPGPSGDGSYRHDCSGYVSMALHLAHSPSTADLPNYGYEIPWQDLKPGDFFNRSNTAYPVGHSFIFEKWDDNNGNFSYYSWGSTPISHGHTNIHNSSWVGWPASSYKIYRYNNIVDDAPPPPTGVRAVVTATGGQEYGIAPDGHVMSTFWSGGTDNGGWHEWFSIPTGYGDGVTAPNATVTVTSINGQTQLFTTAADGHVISTFWAGNITTNGGWHEWFSIPTGFYDGKTAPNATVSATTINGQPQLFTTAPDGHVMSTFWSGANTNGGWHDWFAIPTGFYDGVAAANAIVTVAGSQLYTRAPDGHVMSTFWSGANTNGGWHEWFSIPTGYGDGLTANNAAISVTTINGQTQLFTTASDGHVMSTFWWGSVENGGWHGWFSIPTGFYDGVAAANAIVTVAGSQLYTRAPDGHVMSTFWSGDITTNGGWHEWFSIPTGYGDGVTAANAAVSVTTLNGQTQLFTTAADGHVVSTFWAGNITTNGGWHEWFSIPTGFYDGKMRLS
ncbi:hypothetical protein [Kutzneria sp. 744]|uniref:hypothetical protein n=1 Tax=Kutzneria sp. (strain 744) TaxID=345341 RepID=UPI0004B71460|nr:hypothetical protein [Kutzneria sp. 744]